MIRGLIIFGGVLIFLAAVMNGAANWLEMQPTPQDERFKVVDKYRGCGVVRYTPQNDAKYHYLMYC
jgi:hypothetical protein